MASRGLRIFGSGTVSTRTSFLPYQQRAFILFLLFGDLYDRFSTSIDMGIRRGIAGRERSFRSVMHFFLLGRVTDVLGPLIGHAGGLPRADGDFSGFHNVL